MDGRRRPNKTGSYRSHEKRSSRKSSRPTGGSSYPVHLPNEYKAKVLYDYIQKHHISQYVHMTVAELDEEKLKNNGGILGNLLGRALAELRHDGILGEPPATMPEEPLPPASKITQMIAAAQVFTPAQDAAVKPATPEKADLLRTLMPPSPVTEPPGRYIPPAARVPVTTSTAATPPISQLRWIPADDENIGHFFINKIYTDREKTIPWQPPHFVDTLTRIKTFEELVPTTDLQMVLFSDDRGFSEILQDNFFSLLPSNVDLTVVCGLTEQRDQSSPFVHQLKIELHEHTDSSDSTACPKFHNIKVKPMNLLARDFRARLLLLRYQDSVRLIVPSGSFSHFCWESLSLFGWYCDLPLSTSWADQMDIQPTDFSRDLHNFLVSIRIDPIIYLEKCNFGVLSEAVQIIYTKYGTNKEGAMGLKKVESLKNNLYWPEATKKQSLCQLTGLGSTTTISSLTSRLFDLDKALDKPQNKDKIKILYPSHNVVKTWESKHGMNIPDSFWWSQFKNKDKFFLTTPFLHNIDCPEEVLPKANVYLQYTVLEDDKNPDRSHHYGWMVTGSQTLGEGSWGAEKPHMGDIFYRCELAVGIFPYQKQTETGRVVYCFDLSQVGLQFHSPIPHAIVDIPFTPTVREIDRLFHLIGYIEGNKDRHMVIKRLPQDSAICSCRAEGVTATALFPIICPITCTMDQHTLAMYSADKALRVGAVVAFMAMKDKKAFRAGKITNCFENEKAACEYFFPNQKDVWQSIDMASPVPCYVTVLARIKKGYAFLEALSQNHPFYRAATASQTCSSLCFDLPATSIFIHEDSLWEYANKRSWPRVGSIFCVHVTVQVKSRVNRIINIFTRDEDALDAYGLKLDLNQQQTTKAPPGSRMAMLGLKSENDVMSYLSKFHNSLQVELIKEIAPSQHDMETLYPMKATKISSDLDWLERHVSMAMCDGDFPSRTDGCHSVEVLQGMVSALKEKHLV